MTAVLDNLISEKRSKPVIAIFIDPRSSPNPGGTNRRASEYMMNKKYADFVCDELVPAIDSNYKTIKSPEARAILGTSLGGINSAYFGYSRSDVFRLIGINSPAFWYKEEIFSLYENGAVLPLKIFMSTGTINDTQPEAKRMKALFDVKGYPNLYIEVPEGHSWGNWRALLDEMLICFFKDEIKTGMRDKTELPAETKLIGSYPNPFNPSTSISYQLSSSGNVQLKIFDLLGNEIDTLVDKSQTAGRYEIKWTPDNLSSGIYLCRLTGDKFSFSRKMVFIK
jgi:enterochelin esterase family protein